MFSSKCPTEEPAFQKSNQLAEYYLQCICGLNFNGLRHPESSDLEEKNDIIICM